MTLSFGITRAHCQKFGEPLCTPFAERNRNLVDQIGWHRVSMLSERVIDRSREELVETPVALPSAPDNQLHAPTY
jgi:hypothetical protein